MTGWKNRTLVEDLVARGLDDWISMAEVHSVAKETGLDDPETLRGLAVGLISEVLTRGLMHAGEVDGGEHKVGSALRQQH